MTEKNLLIVKGSFNIITPHNKTKNNVVPIYTGKAVET